MPDVPVVLEDPLVSLGLVVVLPLVVDVVPLSFDVSVVVGVVVFVVVFLVVLPCCPDVARVDPLGSSALLSVVQDSAATAVAAITHVRNVLMAHLPPPERGMRSTAASV
jgi:hypothetical protein